MLDLRVQYDPETRKIFVKEHLTDLACFDKGDHCEFVTFLSDLMAAEDQCHAIRAAVRDHTDTCEREKGL